MILGAEGKWEMTRSIEQAQGRCHCSTSHARRCFETAACKPEQVHTQLREVANSKNVDDGEDPHELPGGTSVIPRSHKKLSPVRSLCLQIQRIQLLPDLEVEVIVPRC